MSFSEKLKALRAAEGLSQSQFCKIIDIPVSTLKNLEGSHSEPKWSTLTKITQHPQFSKYTLWLMSDTVAPTAGQIAPNVEHQEPNKAKAD